MLLLGCIVLSSHDLFLKLDTFLPANKLVELYLLNGTFNSSENVIARKRTRNVELVGRMVSQTPQDHQWA
ncbi:MAG: DUF4198 domain-containing protein, partial [Tunicatimonas sp.]